jgi:hypothetical protein
VSCFNHMLDVDSMGYVDTKVWKEEVGAGRRVRGMNERQVRAGQRHGWAGGKAVAAWSTGLPGLGGDTVGGTGVVSTGAWAGRNRCLHT